MSLGLCMIVKNEINRIDSCLKPLIDRLDQIVILDTGSSDGTIERLQEVYGITPLRDTLEDKPCLNKASVRNRGFSLLKTDWILTLDADERIEPSALNQFNKIDHPENISGYFGQWTNHIEGQPSFEDYKLFIFRNGLNMSGLIHENIQTAIRQNNLQAQWLNDLTVNHFPETCKLKDKATLYKQRLYCALEQEPDWYRYHWFLGYMLYQEGDWEQSRLHLNQAFNSPSTLFPVESINSGMVLTEIYAQLGLRQQTEQTVQQCLRIYQQYSDDFEVQINTRMKPWLENTSMLLEQDELTRIKAYRFAR